MNPIEPMAKPLALLLALAAAGCGAAAEPGHRLANTAWVSPVAPGAVDTLVLQPDGRFRWFVSEAEVTNAGTYRVSGDTVFLDETVDAGGPDEHHPHRPWHSRLVLRGGTLRLVFAHDGSDFAPLTEWNPPYVLTRHPPR